MVLRVNRAGVGTHNLCSISPYRDWPIANENRGKVTGLPEWPLVVTTNHMSRLVQVQRLSYGPEWVLLTIPPYPIRWPRHPIPLQGHISGQPLEHREARVRLDKFAPRGRTGPILCK